MTEIDNVREADFDQQVLQSTLPVMIDFSAVWCGPCKMLEPIVHQLAEEWQGKARVLKVDVDESSNLAVQYGVMGVPTLMLFVNGEAVQRISGYQPKEKIVAKFGAYL